MDFFSSLLDGIHKKNYTAGLFLLILSVSGNYIAETLSCSTRYILTHNMLAKQIMILFMIYFIKQHREHKKFDYLKFILGKVNCDHNK